MSENVIKFPSAEDIDVAELRAVETLANESRAEIGRRMLALQERRGKKGWKEWILANSTNSGRYQFYTECMKEALTGKTRKERHEDVTSINRILPTEPKQISFGAGTDKARPLVRPYVEKGITIPREQLKREGVSEKEIANASLVERGRQEGLQEAATTLQPIDTSILNASAQEKFAALERRLRAQLENEFQTRVEAAVIRRFNEILLPKFGEQLREADLLRQHGKPFTNIEFRQILAGVHPDCLDTEKRAQAFTLLKSRQVLLRPEEGERGYIAPGIKPPALPRTLAELEALRNKSS